MTFFLIFGVDFTQLLHMCSPRPPGTSALDIAAYYTAHASDMLIGSTMAAWASGFVLPFATVITAQMIRLKKGWSVWSLMQILGGIMMSIWLVLLPDLWGT